MRGSASKSLEENDQFGYASFKPSARPPRSSFADHLETGTGDDFDNAMKNAPLEELEYECRRRINEFCEYYKLKDENYHNDLKETLDKLFFLVAQSGNPGATIPGSKDEFEFYRPYFEDRIKSEINRVKQMPHSSGQQPPDTDRLLSLLKHFHDRVSKNPSLTFISNQGNQQVVQIASSGTSAVAAPVAGAMGAGAKLLYNIGSAFKTVYDVFSTGWTNIKKSFSDGWSWFKKTIKENPIKGILGGLGLAGGIAVTVLFPYIVLPIAGTVYGGVKVAQKGMDFHSQNTGAENRLKSVTLLLGPRFVEQAASHPRGFVVDHETQAALTGLMAANLQAITDAHDRDNPVITDHPAEKKIPVAPAKVTPAAPVVAKPAATHTTTTHADSHGAFFDRESYLHNLNQMLVALRAANTVSTRDIPDHDAAKKAAEATRKEAQERPHPNEPASPTTEKKEAVEPTKQ